LTTRERATIQTFPENFHLVGSKTDVEQVIGNAVPVKLAQYVAERLRTHIAARQINGDGSPLRQSSLFQPGPEASYASKPHVTDHSTLEVSRTRP
ncbi:MAG: hypothetical protein EAZ37_01995, partial [Burkholderiales bacterium]